MAVDVSTGKAHSSRMSQAFAKRDKQLKPDNYRPDGVFVR